VWTPDGELGHVQPFDANGKGHGIEIERDSGRTTWCAQWVHGKQHGLVIQFDARGQPLLVTRFVRGRGTDIWIDCGKVSEVREMVDGRPHGSVRWGDPRRPWEEEHYCRGERHGIFRQWSDGTLQKGFPQFYLNDSRVTRRAYLAAQAIDPSLPRYDKRDDVNLRVMPPVVREAIARAKRLKHDLVVLEQVRRQGVVQRGVSSSPSARKSRRVRDPRSAKA
jgi:hypothetical protein